MWDAPFRMVELGSFFGRFCFFAGGGVTSGVSPGAGTAAAGTGAAAASAVGGARGLSAIAKWMLDANLHPKQIALRQLQRFFFFFTLFPHQLEVSLLEPKLEAGSLGLARLESRGIVADSGIYRERRAPSADWLV